MSGLLRELLRQRLRSALTVSGVALSILSLVVLGALGERFRAMVDEANAYAAGLVRLYTKTNQAGTNPGIGAEVLAEVRSWPEVERVAPQLQLLFDGFDVEASPLSLLTPQPIVLGLPAGEEERLRPALTLRAGRWLLPDDERAAVVAESALRQRGLTLGGEVTIRHRSYRVVGVFAGPEAPFVPTGIVPYRVLEDDLLVPAVERARGFLRALLSSPAAAVLAGGRGLDLDALAREFVRQQEALYRVYDVLPRDRSPDSVRRLAARLRQRFPELAVIDPDGLAREMEQAVAWFLVITTIVTVLSTVVGGLLVVNTMAMAVLERRAEIAVKAALGATPLQVAGELTAESGLLGGLGGLLGLALGVAAVALAGPGLAERLQGTTEVFRLTPRLLVGAPLYGVLLGLVAGGLPALRAARIDPAVTLREA